MSNYSSQTLIEKLNNGEVFSFDESFEYSRMCSRLLSDGKEKEARELIIRVLDKINMVPEKTQCIWNDLVISVGLYPYADISEMSSRSLVNLEYHRSNNIPHIFFHSEQLDSVFSLMQEKSFVLSAPTSFGKSLLIEEIIASKKYTNIVIIQPTLALLDETRKKLKKYRNYYNIVVSTSQLPKDRNIFLFTGERVCEYREFPSIDFFVIDEFYKLSLKREESDRAVALNLALYKLLRHTKKFMMLGPHISDISQEFLKRAEAEWKYTEFATVAINVKDCHMNKPAKGEKEGKLFDLLDTLSEPTLIYCSSPNKTNELATAYIQSSASKLVNNYNQDLCNWISENIHSDWLLIKMLEKGVGVHHGGLPRHIGSAVVDAFNSGTIKYLFCTSTLIEGVNTSAKNVVFFHKKKGNVAIDYFDYKNIAGRSGRMMQHLIGSVYKFEKQPDEQVAIIDIPIIDQDEKAPFEMLVQINQEDLSNTSKKRLVEFEKLPADLQIVLKENVGINIKGQFDLVKYITIHFEELYDSLCWTGIPKLNQLESSINLCWRYFKSNGQQEGGVYTPRQLAYLALNYYHYKSLKAVINASLKSDYFKDMEKGERTQLLINNALQTSKHWFDYKLPKWLSVINALQEYVCTTKGEKAGSYVYFIQTIENHFLPIELTVLLEYDVPASTIKKLESLLYGCKTIDKIILILQNSNLTEIGLSKYEQKCIASLL